MNNKVLIIDSGMRNLGGHNFSYTRAVQAALKDRAFSVSVFANKNLVGDLATTSGYRQVFSFGAYDFPPGNGHIRDLRYLYAQSLIYCDELERAFQQATNDFALVFCHTVNDFELIAWKRFLSRRKLAGNLMILMRQTPGFRSCSRWKRIAHPYWRIKPHYLNAIHARMKDRFVLLTDSEPLTEDYSRIYRHRIVTLPIPINEMILNAHQNGAPSSNGIRAHYKLSPDGRICIGYMGDARPSKGFNLLPELIKRISSSASPKTRFVIQCPNSASGFDNGQPTREVEELKKLAQEPGSAVTLISEKLSERDYADLFQHLDIVLIPYTSNYMQATSGIFAEALALAKPVAVPGGTWMARELSRSGGGVEFKRGDVADLAAKVVELAGNYDEYATKAKSFSATWKSFHNCHTLADILLKESGLAPTLGDK